jgi:hypothetical protein
MANVVKLISSSSKILWKKEGGERRKLSVCIVRHDIVDPFGDEFATNNNEK